MKQLNDKQVAVKPKKREHTPERDLKSNIVALNKRYANIKEVSEYTSIPIKTLYEWCSLGKIPSIKYGRKLLFDLHDIDKVMQSLKRFSINAKKTINKIIEDPSEKKYNVPDSDHAGTIEYERGGE